MQVKVTQSFNRLDKFLFQYFESIPLSLIQRLIRQYKIKINNKKSKANSDLKKGDINKKKLFTGDIGYQDKDKYLYIVGRKTKFIKFFGKRLDLKQIENFLYSKGFKVRCLVVDKFLKLNLYNRQSLESEIKINLKEKFNINQNFIIINKKFTKTFKDF